MMYSVVKKCATQINAIGELQELHRQGKEPIVVFDPEAKDELRYLISLPKEDVDFHPEPTRLTDVGRSEEP